MARLEDIANKNKLNVSGRVKKRRPKPWMMEENLGTHAETDPRTHAETDPRTHAETDPGTHAETEPRTGSSLSIDFDNKKIDFDYRFEKGSSRYRILKFFVKSCQENGSNYTDKFRHYELREKLSISDSNLKKLIQRLKAKGYIFCDKEVDFQSGRSGWIRYRVHPEILEQLSTSSSLKNT